MEAHSAPRVSDTLSLRPQPNVNRPHPPIAPHTPGYSTNPVDPHAPTYPQGMAECGRAVSWMIASHYFGSEKEVKGASSVNAIIENKALSVLEALGRQRENFDTLVQKHVFGPIERARCRRQSDDVNVNNPLSTAKENPWVSYYEDEELKQEIEMDVLRTYQEMPFFQQESVQASLGKLLFVFSKEFAALSYRQGMHELLAPLLWVRTHHTPLTGLDLFTNVDMLSSKLTRGYIEHDTYYMFVRLMELMRKWYQQPPASTKGSTRASMEESPVVAKILTIQNVLLKECDPEVHHVLTSQNVAPQIYGIRWIRLIFGREMEMPHLLHLWDVILHDHYPMELLDYIAVALLMAIRETILTGGPSSVLTVLMRYPSVKDTTALTQHAKNLRHDNTCTTRRIPSMGGAISSSIAAIRTPQAIGKVLNDLSHSEEVGAVLTGAVTGMRNFFHGAGDAFNNNAKPVVAQPRVVAPKAQPHDVVGICSQLLTNEMEVLKRDLTNICLETGMDTPPVSSLRAIRHIESTINCLRTNTMPPVRKLPAQPVSDQAQLSGNGQTTRSSPTSSSLPEPVPSHPDPTQKDSGARRSPHTTHHSYGRSVGSTTNPQGNNSKPSSPNGHHNYTTSASASPSAGRKAPTRISATMSSGPHKRSPMRSLLSLRSSGSRGSSNSVSMNQAVSGELNCQTDSQSDSGTSDVDEDDEEEVFAIGEGVTHGTQTDSGHWSLDTSTHGVGLDNVVERSSTDKCPQGTPTKTKGADAYIHWWDAPDTTTGSETSGREGVQDHSPGAIEEDAAPGETYRTTIPVGSENQTVYYTEPAGSGNGAGAGGASERNYQDRDGNHTGVGYSSHGDSDNFDPISAERDEWVQEGNTSPSFRPRSLLVSSGTGVRRKAQENDGIRTRATGLTEIDSSLDVLLDGLVESGKTHVDGLHPDFNIDDFSVPPSARSKTSPNQNAATQSTQTKSPTNSQQGIYSPTGGASLSWKEGSKRTDETDPVRSNSPMSGEHQRSRQRAKVKKVQNVFGSVRTQKSGDGRKMYSVTENVEGLDVDTPNLGEAKGTANSKQLLDSLGETTLF